MKKVVKVKSYTRQGYKVSGPVKVHAHTREIDVKKASSGSSMNPIDMSSKSPKQEAIAIFYNGGYKIFPFQGHDEFLKLQKKYGNGKVINGQTVKQFIVYEEREQQEYPRNKINQTKKLTYNEWEEKVTYELKMMLDITNSDAQGIVEAQPFKMQQSWTKGLSPKETAKIIDEESSKKEKENTRIGPYDVLQFLKKHPNKKFTENKLAKMNNWDLRTTSLVATNGYARGLFNWDKSGYFYQETSKKATIVKVRLLRAEGPISQTGKWMEFDSVDKANAQLSRNRQTVDGGYDKHDYELIYSDGSKYKGRYDLKRDDYNPSILKEVRDFLNYQAYNSDSAENRKSAREFAMTHQIN